MGIRLSQRPATPEHPFGHGKELYFWSLIVVVLIFGLGGGISFYEGVQHIRHPQLLHDPTFPASRSSAWSCANGPRSRWRVGS